MTDTSRTTIGIVTAGLLWAAAAAPAADWPTFRHDRRRTSATDERLVPPLEPIWTFRSQAARLACRFSGDLLADVTPEHNRTALPISAAGDALYFTSQSEGRLVCLDAATGQVRWQHVAGAALNRAATVAGGRVYVGGDDGFVSCLDAATGGLVWRHKAAPADRWFFSYGRLASAWPVRSDVVVDPDPDSGRPTAYFGAGVFPHDGTFLFAVDAATGERIWCNGVTCETNFRYSLSPAGHLYVTGNHVYVPMDFKSFRWAIFNAYRRGDGSHNNWANGDPENPGNNNGGPFGPLTAAFAAGKPHGGAAGEGYRFDPESIQGILPAVRGAPIQYDPDACPVIWAGGVVYNVAFKADGERGVTGMVYARDPAAENKELWSAEIPAWPHQVIAANGRLFVATRSGTIHAFGPAGAARHGTIEERVEAPVSADAACVRAAEAIVAGSGVRAGYAVVLDCTDGALAYELARTSELSVCAVFADAERARAARTGWVGAGLHVSRLVAIEAAPSTPLPLPAFHADLVLSEAAARGGELPRDAAELVRLVKPIVGQAWIGGAQPAEALAAWTAAGIADPLTGAGPVAWTVAGADGSRWASWKRPRLVGGGGWTHHRGDAGNSMCSQDDVLRPPLGAIWYGRPYAVRHDKRMSPPIIVDGVLLNHFKGKTEAFDAYTGRELWHADLVTDTVAGPGSVFFRTPTTIQRVDPHSGRALAEFPAPLAGGWTDAAVAADGTMLYGLAIDKDVSAVVAIEVASGRTLWTLGGPGAPRQWGGWSAIADGRLYFLGAKAEGAAREQAVAEMRDWLPRLPGDEYKKLAESLDTHDIRLLAAVDGRTGQLLYERGVDVTNAGGGQLLPYASGGGDKQQNPYINASVQAHGGVVVFGTAGSADKLWAVWPSGGYKHRGISVYDGASGRLLWYRLGNYRSRLAVTDDYVLAEPYAFRLTTGEPRMRAHPVTGAPAVWSFWRPDKHCGIFNASRHFAFGRSRGIGYQDLLTDQGLYTFIHSRASCSIDTASGGGVMIKPPHAISCRCEISMPFTVALGTVRTPLVASQLFSQSGAHLPVKHLYLDLAATGDRRDVHGNLWSPPRDPNGLMHGSAARVEYYEGGGPLQRSSGFTPIVDTDVPFVFATLDRGLKQCVVPLDAPGGQPRRYLVRLGFSAPPGDRPGQRVFDVTLDGRTVLDDFDVVATAGAADKAVWKEFPVTAGETLTVGLRAAAEKPDLASMPVIAGLVVLREDGP